MHKNVHDGDTCTVIKDRFEGMLFRSAVRVHPQTAVLVVGGSEGGIHTAAAVAEAFSSRGTDALAVAYFGTKQTPRHLSLITIETILYAVQYLRGLGYTKTGIYGISKGAELALVSASLISEISFVIALSPACCVFEGIAKPAYCGTSSWSWQGHPLPYVSFKDIRVNISMNLLKNHEMGFRSAYEQVLPQRKNEENTIKVENIRGPVLLLAADNDAQWPSAEMAHAVSTRLEEHAFPYQFRVQTFYPAGHILCPVNSAKTRKLLRILYMVERTFSTECDKARADAWELTLSWINSI
jgi:dienelactone hydrolase